MIFGKPLLFSIAKKVTKNATAVVCTC